MQIKEQDKFELWLNQIQNKLKDRYKIAIIKVEKYDDKFNINIEFVKNYNFVINDNMLKELYELELKGNDAFNELCRKIENSYLQHILK